MRFACLALLLTAAVTEAKKNKDGLVHWAGSGAGAVDAVGKLAPRPLLLLHGTADEIVPPWHSEMVYTNARSPKRLYMAAGAKHGQLYETHRAEVEGYMLELLETVQ